ncbi:MAG TPA: DUF5615 family PIN-like protein [Chthoniobacteraceae bacterium]|nr:DUF5615 family PIN-like protein [Chthoniobacteraceae bacterium]
MEFLLDHDVPDRVGTALQRRGHRVARLREVLPITASDPDILRFACNRGWILITCNMADFATLARAEFDAQRDISGLILLERRSTRDAECASVIRLLGRAGESGLQGNVNIA